MAKKPTNPRNMFPLPFSGIQPEDVIDNPRKLPPHAEDNPGNDPVRMDPAEAKRILAESEGRDPLPLPSNEKISHSEAQKILATQEGRQGDQKFLELPTSKPMDPQEAFKQLQIAESDAIFAKAIQANTETPDAGYEPRQQPAQATERPHAASSPPAGTDATQQSQTPQGQPTPSSGATDMSDPIKRFDDAVRRFEEVIARFEQAAEEQGWQ